MQNLIGLLALLLSPLLFGEQSNTIRLSCKAVPMQDEQICTAETQSPYGPWDQVVYYRKTPQGELELLGSDKGGVATFGGIEFSPQGTYLMISWAEEGHPIFYFYNTKSFLNGNIHDGVGHYSEYFFEHIDFFGDNGVVIFGLSDNTGNCIDTKTYPSITDKQACHHFLRLSQ